MLGKGSKYALNEDELKWVKLFFKRNPALKDKDTEVPSECLLFTRVLFRSEIHSEQYSRVRTSCSCHVEIEYAEGNAFGTLNKLFLMTIGAKKYRLALVTTFASLSATRMKVERINLNKPYSTGRIVLVDCLVRKVIFVGPSNSTSVLTTPHKTSRR
jgi:hypothetical protein